MSALTIDGLTKEFAGPKRNRALAVDSLDLAVGQGEFLVLLGPSGCGKTTTLRMVAGLETPTKGCVRFGEKLVYDHATGVDVPAHRREIGMVFQSYALWPHLTVRQNIAYPLRARRKRAGLKAGWVEEIARSVECESLLHRHPGQLSGGQQQRIALARALVARPALMLFDEPLSNLDAKLRERTRTEIRELHTRLGFTALYVTHDQTEALTLGTRLAIMRSGRIEQVGRPQEVFDRPSTSYVADFIGIGNAVELHRDATGWSWEAGRVAGALGGTEAGPIQVRFRADDVTVVPGGDSPGHELGTDQVSISGGVVADVLFTGRSRDVVVEFADGIRFHVTVRAEDAGPFARGHAVTLVARRSAVLAYNADGCLVDDGPVQSTAAAAP